MRPLVALVLLAPALSLAQPSGSSLWSGGGPASDVGERVAVAPAGEVAVVGTFEQTATFGAVSVTSADAPAARSDAFVVLYGADGTALWARRMGTDVFNDFGTGVAVSPSFSAISGDGAVYVSGFFTGIATFDGGANPDTTLTTRSDFDAFLAAYSPAGDLLWVQQAGGVEQDTGRDVVVVSTWDVTGAVDEVYWAGSFSGTATWGTGTDAVTRTSAGSSDGFVARYRDGELDWVLTGGGPESDDLRALSTYDRYGDGAPVYVAGTFRSVATFGGTPLASRGLSDVAVLALDPTDGSVAWARQVGGNGNDYARGVAAAYDGQVGVAGSFENTMLVGTDVLTSAGFSDAFLATFTDQGVEVGGHRGGGEGFDIANAVAANPFFDTVTRGGGGPALPLYAVVGYVDGPATFGSTSVAAQGVDAFVALYRTPGADFPPSTTPPALVDVLLVGGTDSDRGSGAAFTTGGNGEALTFPLHVTGSFRGTAAFGDSAVTSAGSNDVFVASLPTCPTYSCPVSVAAEDGPAGAAHLSIAPNPARSGARLSLTLAAPGEAAISVVDALGRVAARLHAGALPAGETVWTAPPLAPGAYWLVARADGRTVREAFAVVR